MTISKNLALSLPLALTALSAHAASVNIGQPLLVADVATSGATLDNFNAIGPTGIQNLDASAEISSAHGANPALLGEIITLFIGEDGSSSFPVIDLMIGSTVVNVLAGTEGFAVDNTFTDHADGVIGASFIAVFPNTSTYDPITDTSIFEYLDPFAEFSDLAPRRYADVEIGVNVYYDGGFPVRTQDELDAAGNVIGTFVYYEGSLDINRIEVGLVGGPPVPVPTVPLPATLPLVAFALSILGLAQTRKS